ncbi:SID1 transmembrane family member 1 [Eumeta japonica]|uniref:SID1 transmembrane family member 1 n=1 Tax=Eumeta variegata TaxID=151549 RepID=A0A4C1WQC2_EUMVA|nr:SID1 transmembrane family member 1 [Eumeta japonica]
MMARSTECPGLDRRKQHTVRAAGAAAVSGTGPPPPSGAARAFEPLPLDPHHGSLDICYYNFLCAHPAGQVSDFNHVFSNLGYLLLGVLFVLQVNRRRLRRKKTPLNDVIAAPLPVAFSTHEWPHPLSVSQAYGIPAHYGLLYSLGVGMMVVALLSATYHICPNRLNFQFDTAFMYVMAVISMVKIYQSRHPDVNARAHATFGVLAVIIALGTPLVTIYS